MAETSSNYLFTGAGFTHNVGTPLARGMWSFIFNSPEIQSAEAVRALMTECFDYEDIYHRVKNEDAFSSDDRKAIDDAIAHAFCDLDKIVKSFGAGGHRHLTWVNS